MRRLSAVLVLLMVGSQLAHAQGPRPYTVSARPAVFGGTPSPGCIGRPYVLIANGASDQMDVKEKLDAALEYSACPMITRTIPWANPNDTTSTNYRNKDAQLMGAAMICAQVQKIHQVNPTSPITLIGYCAGSYVVLLAAEQLPPGSVDRIILLAPSVSSCYDVRLALRASKCGMDNFYTSDDTVLELKESEVGTTDGRRTTTAGRTGFLIARTLPGDPSLAGLRQYNFVTCPYILGGHFATLWQSFIRNNLLPIMPCGPGGCGRGPVCPPPGTFPPPGPVPPPYPPPQGPGPYAPPVPPGTGPGLPPPPPPAGPPVPPPAGPPIPPTGGPAVPPPGPGPMPALPRVQNGPAAPPVQPTQPMPPLNRTAGPAPSPAAPTPPLPPAPTNNTPLPPPPNPVQLPPLPPPPQF